MHIDRSSSQPESLGDTGPRLRLVDDRFHDEIISGAEDHRRSGFALSIVIPAFNEASRLPKLFESLLEQIDLDATEIVIVDDGSTDTTAEVAGEFLRTVPNGYLIQLTENSGKGRAIRSGVAHTTGDVVVFMDADAATDLSSLKPVIHALDDFDIAIGSRSHTDAQVHRAHRYRAYMGGAFNAVTRRATGLPFRDTQCGFKAFRGVVARLVFAESTVNGFAFDVEILRMSSQLGFTIAEQPVLWTHQPGSKIRHLADPARMLIDIFRIRLSKPTGTLSMIRVDSSDYSSVMKALESLGSPMIVRQSAEGFEIVAGLEPKEADQRIVDRLNQNAIPFEYVVRSLSSIVSSGKKFSAISAN